MVQHKEEGQVLLASEATFEKVLHKGTGSKNVGMSAMLQKDYAAQKAASDQYFQHWDNKTAKAETKETREARVADYDTITRQYYNLATDFYEYGFGQSFHFGRASKGESFTQCIARHEHYIAHMIDIKKDMKVLDVGCGVGGPAREIAKFTGAYITGINLNEYQVERATWYAAKEKLDDQVQFVQGDFMKLPFEDNTFDAVYAIEATVHAPSLQDVYSEIFRVLKPGGKFGVYEWVMTETYDNDNLHHREARLNIEQGNGIANMVKASEALRSIKAAGFDLLLHADMADQGDLIPWYWPLDAGSWRHAQTLGDLMYTFRMTYFGRYFTRYLLVALETVRLAPPGMVKTSDSLCAGAAALVLGGKEKIFTPMYLMIGRKPQLKEE